MTGKRSFIGRDRIAVRIAKVAELAANAPSDGAGNEWLRICNDGAALMIYARRIDRGSVFPLA